MAKEPDDFTSRVLRDIQATLAEHGRKLDELSASTAEIRKQQAEFSALVTFSLGKSSKTEFAQSRQAARIDELSARLAKVLGEGEGGLSEPEQAEFGDALRENADRLERDRRLEDLLDQFVALSPEEQQRQFAAAEIMLRAEADAPSEPTR